MNKKKIAILAKYPIWLHVDNIPGKSNHYAVWLTALKDAFKSQEEYDIHWIILCKKIRKIIHLNIEHQTFHLIPCGSRKIAQILNYYPDRWRIKNFLNKLKPDLVHAWGTEECYGLCAKDFIGNKIISVQGLLTAYAQRAKIEKFEQIQSKFEKQTFQSCPLITTESMWAHDRVLELCPSAKIMLFDYAVESPFFAATRRLTKNPTCLLISSNTPVKNIPFAISVFSRPELRHITFYLAGIPSNAYNNLPDNIIPLGMINREQIIEYLSSTWCLVHPSLADTGPTALKEARVMRVPAVVTHDCGAKDYICHEKSGYIVDSNNEDEFVNAILAITKSPNTSISMGAYESEQCREALSESKMIDNLLQIYTDILN